MPYLFQKPFFRFLLLSAALLLSSAAAAVDLEPTGLRFPLTVTAGESFYFESEPKIEVERIVLSEPVAGRMPGSFRIPFSFAIDGTELRFTHSANGFRWYSASEDQARAWHGMVGDVLARGDSVGMRIRDRDGRAEWFVDNSNYNAPLKTIYHRKHDPEKDPDFRVEKTLVRREDAFLREVTYKGLRDGQIVMMVSEGRPGDYSSEEYFFPIEEMPMTIAIKGFRAAVSSVSAAELSIEVISPFSGAGS